VTHNRKPSAAILWRLATNRKRLRKARGYTQVQLAARTGLPHRYISNIEQEPKNIGLANLESLASGLECSEMDLFMPVNEGDQ